MGRLHAQSKMRGAAKMIARPMLLDRATFHILHYEDHADAGGDHKRLVDEDVEPPLAATKKSS